MTYRPLTETTVAGFLGAIAPVAARLGGTPDVWRVREVGDGNLNLVFLVDGPLGSVAAKQALPYVRLVGESWPLPLTRAYYERLALADQALCTPDLVPALIHTDDVMALTVMERLTPHRTLRAARVEGERFPLLGDHLARFLADNLFFTSDLALGAAEKKARIAAYIGNTAMCRITEDLIFDEPYFAAPMNWHTPGLEPVIDQIRQDIALRLTVQDLKARFLAAPEALLHGDLHTGSIMVTPDETKIIDPEFATYGPIGFDVGMVLANLWMGHCADLARGRDDGWLLTQARTVWDGFAHRFAQNWRADIDSRGSLHAIARHDPVLREAAITRRLAAIHDDALGYVGCEIIRRIIGLAHIADFESIVDMPARIAAQTGALNLACALLTGRDTTAALADLAQSVTT